MQKILFSPTFDIQQLLKQVSVICLCHNQAPYLREALQSVLDQSHPAVQVIVVDDASTDNSPEVINSLLKGKPEIPFIALQKNLGNCAAFNKGLALATGAYVIDFAMDDVMMPDRIARQVDFFESLGHDYGVIYSNASYIGPTGKWLKDHFAPSATPPQGEVYARLISTYFLPPPTMMFRMEVIRSLGGYDESLAYEDFDFWVRSARTWKYAYQPEVLTAIRRVPGSLSAKAYQKNDRQLHSTYLVCRKAQQLNRSREEDAALVTRLRYEVRQAVLSNNHEEAGLFLDMLQEYKPLGFFYGLLRLVSKLRIDLRWLRAGYQWLFRLFTAKPHLK